MVAAQENRFTKNSLMLNPSIRECFSKAVSVFRKRTDADDQEIWRVLKAEGVEPQIAARLVEFVPLAYGRLLLANSGARFSNFFQRHLPDGGISEPFPFDSDPLWNEILFLAKDDVSSGISKDEFLAVAARSAEIHAANQLLQAGSKLNNLVFTPPLFPSKD